MYWETQSFTETSKEELEIDLNMPEIENMWLTFITPLWKSLYHVVFNSRFSCTLNNIKNRIKQPCGVCEDTESSASAKALKSLQSA